MDAEQKTLAALVDSGRMTPAEMQALKNLVDSMQANLDAHQRLVRELAGSLESLLGLQGPDAGTRRRMLELAATVTSSTGPSQSAAATHLASLVLKSIPAPRPVAVPSPVAKEEKSAC